MEAKPRPPEAVEILGEAQSLEALYGHLPPKEIVAKAAELFPGSLAAVSSFGADSVVLLDLIARIDRHLPVLFLDTGKHFGETLQYRDALVADLSLTDVRMIEPDPDALSRIDPDGTLHARDTEACCGVRKVEPMARAVAPFQAWLTGRKRFQATTRTSLSVFEEIGPRLRINPLARWTTADLAEYMRARRLRTNPLVPYGYLSIGCFPCTQPVQAGADARSGRWAGHAKVECGIHLSGLEQSLTDASL